MINSAVDVSRLQFAVTALYHFLFVPLTLGLAPLLGIMESVYVMTGRDVWKRTTKFWSKLFAVNFAMGVATGITMEFQFGTNWAYYSHYVGDIFGVPLAIEGLMAFFLESTFVGLMIFGWEKLGKVEHLATTWLTAIGANFSALWILIANGWMQNPVGAHFNPDTMRMELTSLYEVFFNEVAQAKFVHTVSAGYVTGSMFVLAISAYYLLRNRETDIAKRSMVVAASFGLASALCVVVLGDESGYTATANQKMKIAGIEAMWKTELAPASFTVIGIPDEKEHTTHYAVKVPYLLGLIATRSLDTSVPGIKELIADAEVHIRDGLKAYSALHYLRTVNRNDEKQRTLLDAHVKNLGYALLLKRYTDDPLRATDEQIRMAAESTSPHVTVLFFSFRIMVGLGLYFIALFASAFWLINVRQRFEHFAFLKLCFFSLPLPWIAAELGWIVAEYGRQPWAIEGILPTYLGVSSTTAGQVWASLTGFVIFYTTLLVVDIYLMTKLIRLGPSGMGYGETAKEAVT
jgi:cytochrome d ubiquinol oxidase subunit I